MNNILPTKTKTDLQVKTQPLFITSYKTLPTMCTYSKKKKLNINSQNK